jgi:hypothetical protein
MLQDLSSPQMEPTRFAKLSAGEDVREMALVRDPLQTKRRERTLEVAQTSEVSKRYATCVPSADAACSTAATGGSLAEVQNRLDLEQPTLKWS